MATMEEVPRVSLSEIDSDEVTVFIELEKPTEDDLVKLYKTYREGGGEAYEPFESKLRECEARSEAAAEQESGVL